MWTDMRAILPDDAFAEFSDFIVFTDGPDEMVAYVLPADEKGTRWQIAADPEDAGDSDFFAETVLHEYFHYMTLNHRQVDYTRKQTADAYNFFLRHYDDFVTAYASTDPSEDICESFTFFILQDRTPDPQQVWEEKLDLFYAYPELVAFRTTVRENLGRSN